MADPSPLHPFIPATSALRSQNGGSSWRGAHGEGDHHGRAASVRNAAVAFERGRSPVACSAGTVAGREEGAWSCDGQVIIAPDALITIQ